MRPQGRPDGPRERVAPHSASLAVTRGRGPCEDLVQQRGDSPVDPIIMRPTIRADEDVSVPPSNLHGSIDVADAGT